MFYALIRDMQPAHGERMLSLLQEAMEFADLQQAGQAWMVLKHTYAGHSEVDPTDDISHVTVYKHLVASVSRLDPTIHVWNARTGERPVLLARRAGGPITSMAFSPTGHLLVAVRAGGEVDVWNPTTGQHVQSFGGYLSSPGAVVIALAWSPDGKWVVSAACDPTASSCPPVLVWDPLTGMVPCAYAPGDSPVLALAWGAVDNHLACTDAAGTLHLGRVDLTSGRIVTLSRREDVVRGARSWSLAFSPDGQRLLVNGLQIWDTRSLTRRADHGGQLTFARGEWMDNQRVLCVYRNVVWLWWSHLAPEEPHQTFFLPPFPLPVALGLSSGTRCVVTGECGGGVNVWEMPGE
jgi:WD40 repeat protein